MNTIEGSYFHFAFGHKLEGQNFFWSNKILDLTLFTDLNQELLFYKIGTEKMQRTNDMFKIFEDFTSSYKKMYPNEPLSNDVLEKLLYSSMHNDPRTITSKFPSYETTTITTNEEDCYELDYRFDGELFIEKNSLLNISFSFDSDNIFYDDEIVLHEVDKLSTLDSELSFLSEYETTYTTLSIFD